MRPILSVPLTPPAWTKFGTYDSPAAAETAAVVLRKLRRLVVSLIGGLLRVEKHGGWRVLLYQAVALRTIEKTFAPRQPCGIIPLDGNPLPCYPLLISNERTRIVTTKLVDSKGRLMLGNRLAGRMVIIDDSDPEHIVITPAVAIPECEA